ncbi:hypothetical protein L596_018737 [Steinernema carpocapsae]|uniref:Uncharacterized protein n=1 Tax=Steinernema carpocapsae TaxID=34508 RepID=A0A4U5N697_STECR|nr:hypothetical protein L596_018737 [Steinernema carpocapsae]
MEHPFFPFVWISHEQLSQILGKFSEFGHLVVKIDLSKCATVIKYSTISMNDFAGRMQSAACPACHIKGADIMRINLPDASGKTQGFALLRSPSSNLHSLQIFHTLAFRAVDSGLVLASFLMPAEAGLSVAPAEAGLSVAPAEAGLSVAPAEAGLSVAPAEAGLSVAPAEAGLSVAPAEAGLSVAPAEAGLSVVPAEAGLSVAPAEAGLSVAPAEAGLSVAPAEAGLSVAPAEAGLSVVPAEAGLSVVPAEAGLAPPP